MTGLIVLVLVGVVLWKLWTPHGSFAREFASLLDRPVGKSSVWSFLTGVQTIGGEYDDRPVLLVVHHKRARHSPGYLIVAMQPTGSSRIAARHEGAFREWLREPDAREAWDDLELRHELALSFDAGWMKAKWTPIGLFVFPGRFEPERWREVLRDMRAVVVSLERDASARPSASETA